MKKHFVSFIFATAVLATGCSKDYEFTLKPNFISAQSTDYSLIAEDKVIINNDDVFTRSTHVTLTVDAENADEMLVTNSEDCSGGGVWETFTINRSWILAGNNGEAKVYTKFRRGQIESECVSDSIIHDSNPPEIIFVQVPSAVSNSGRAQFEINIVDVLSGVRSFECSLDDGALQPCDRQFVLENLAEGMHNLNVRASDNAGNVTEISTYDWTIVLPEPTPVPVPPTPVPEPTPVPVPPTPVPEPTATPVPPTPVPEPTPTPVPPTPVPEPTPVPVPPTPVPEPTPVPVPPTPVPEPTPVPVPPKLPPSVQITKAPAASTANPNAEFSFVGADSDGAVVSYNCKIDNNSWSACASNWTFANLSIGDHVFQVVAVDNDGLVSEPAPHRWTIAFATTANEDKFVIDSIGDKIDIIVVVDNSPSMKEEQKKMADRFSTFISKLSGLDWQLGITSTDADGKKEWEEGRLVPFAGLTKTHVINSLTPNVTSVFEKTVRRKEGGSSNEEGIKALNLLLDRPEFGYAFRERAHLATIVVSDEDERSNGKNLGVLNKPETLIARIKNKWQGTKSHAHHSIVLLKKQTPRDCRQSGANYIGKTYMDLSNLTNGVIGDLCSKDYGNELKAIGDAIKKEAYSALLKCIPTGAVEVNYLPAPSQPIAHTVEGIKLTLKPYPPVGTQVVVRYYCN